MPDKCLASPLQDPPNTIDYLNLVKQELSSDKSALLAFLCDLDEWIWQRLGLGESVSALTLIIRVAKHLRFKPRLLYGLNSVLQPHYRLECLTAEVSEIRFFVLVDGRKAWILSFLRNSPTTLPATTSEIQELISSKGNWEKLLGGNLDIQYLACVGQVLQEILDNESTTSLEHCSAKQGLLHLANMSILPPSVLAHFVLPSNETPAALSTGAEFTNGGGFTDVYRKVIRQVPTCFRVVRVFESSNTMKLYQDFCNEVIIWRQLKHINILPFFGATLELFPKRFCFILPWFRNGSIMAYLKQNPSHDKLTAIVQVVDALDYLHGLEPPLVHKDIKGANVLVRDDLVCVLSDFGLSKHLDSHIVSSSPKGSLNWMAPEAFDTALLSGQDCRPSDIYSLGCTIYEVMTGCPPFSGHHPAAIMRKIMFNERPTLPPSGEWPRGFKIWSLVSQCWSAEPESRPTVRTVKVALQHMRISTSRHSQGTGCSSGDEFENFVPVLNWLRDEISACTEPSPSSESQRLTAGVFESPPYGIPQVIVTACA